MLREVLGALGNEQYRAYVGDIHASGTHLLADHQRHPRPVEGRGRQDRSERGRVRPARHHALGRPADRRPRPRRRADRRPSICPTICRRCRGDERKTKQVLLNLITNSVKFTPAGGSITISGALRSGRRARGHRRRYRHRHPGRRSRTRAEAVRAGRFVAQPPAPGHRARPAAGQGDHGAARRPARAAERARRRHHR